MARRAFNQRIVIRHAGLLRGLRNIVDVRAERDHRLTFAPGGDEGGRNPRNAALDLESFFFENAAQVFGGLELLKSKLAETEDAIDHHLRLLLHAIDLASHIGFHTGFFFRRDFRLCEKTGQGK